MNSRLMLSFASDVLGSVARSSGDRRRLLLLGSHRSCAPTLLRSRLQAPQHSPHVRAHVHLGRHVAQQRRLPRRVGLEARQVRPQDEQEEDEGQENGHDQQNL